MKGKLDVSNEDSHIPLHFLIIKYAAQFIPSGGGNQLVYTGGGSDAVGQCFFLPRDSAGALSEQSHRVGLTPCAGCFLGMQWHS